MKIRRIYSHVIPRDSGFAPNPFWGYCTLACCKPNIRRNENIKEGDWVIGTGSGDERGKLVYAMKVYQKNFFKDYSEDFKIKIPPQVEVKDNRDNRIRQRGDNICYYNGSKLEARKNYFHNRSQMERDVIKGEFVLISKRFYYFGANTLQIPKKLMNEKDTKKNIVNSGQDFKYKFDTEAVEFFSDWLENKIKNSLEDVIKKEKKLALPKSKWHCNKNGKIYGLPHDFEYKSLIAKGC